MGAVEDFVKAVVQTGLGYRICTALLLGGTSWWWLDTNGNLGTDDTARWIAFAVLFSAGFLIAMFMEKLWGFLIPLVSSVIAERQEQTRTRAEAIAWRDGLQTRLGELTEGEWNILASVLNSDQQRFVVGQRGKTTPFWSLVRQGLVHQEKGASDYFRIPDELWAMRVELVKRYVDNNGGLEP